MIVFLLKGIIRDRHRSFFPLIIISIGVLLTVVMHCWIKGVFGEVIESSAKFLTGHVKVVTRAYAENMDQLPTDLALLNVDDIVDNLRTDFPSLQWVERIRFGGLIDAPNQAGETRAQGSAIGLAIDLLSPNSPEVRRLNIEQALLQGKLPNKSGQILISDDLARNLDIHPGQMVTLLSSTMYGSMAMQNFMISGTLKFGIIAMDKGALLMDIRDAQMALDMQQAAAEILGYFPNEIYDDQAAAKIKADFNVKYSTANDEFAPLMLQLRDQNDLAGMIDYISGLINVFIMIFVLAMSLVLWNAGLLAGLRRYGEMGLRLAIGENKSHVYRTLIYESIIIGIIGSVVGSVLGLGLAYILQTKGINIGNLMKNATLMLPNIIRANITPPAYFVGFIPGLLSTVLGTLLSGIGIYRRQTAQLFKELEV